MTALVQPPSVISLEANSIGFMAKARISRRLTAILAADVVGYTRMMAGDEAGTLAALKRHREVVFEPAVEQYNGRIVKLIGDGTLVEFASVVDAVNCALAIQRILANEATTGPKITLRIGVNLGDVIIDGDDIYGDGVNVAARLEPLAEPGGICVASIVNESIGNRVDVTFENGGEIHVKNVDRPISMWKWHPKTGNGPVAAPNLEQDPTKKDKPTVPNKGYRFLASVQPQSDSNLDHPAKSRTLLPVYTRNVWVWAGLVLLFLVIFVGSWRPWKEGVELAGPHHTSLSSHEKPSIAVLPFINMSADRSQEYFSDGMTEDLITDLSRISGLFVIARFTTFTYKRSTKNVQQIARELGVSHILTGSVQKADNRIRINAQLIDAKTKLQVWANRYDRELSDVFAMQDEITQKIVSALSIRLKLSEKVRLSRSAKVIPEAYDMLLRGIDRYRRLTREAIIESREFFERAIALDPKFARAHADLALTYT
ncbi:MAG: FlgO family outer membrane protein [Pseudolabrys sp.]